MFSPPSKDDWAKTIPFDPKFVDYYKSGWNDAVAGKELTYPFPHNPLPKKNERTFKDDCNHFYFCGFYDRQWR